MQVTIFSTFQRVLASFRRTGGIRAIGGHIKLSIVGKVLRFFCGGILRRRPLQKIYSDIEAVTVKALRKRYIDLICSRLEHYEYSSVESKRSDKVWFCWLQGLDNATPVVKACYESFEGTSLAMYIV